MLKNFTSSLSQYWLTLSDIFELNNLKILLTKLVLLVSAFIAPIIHIIFGVFFLVMADLVTGVLASLKRKQKITSSKLSRTISKILVYLVTIIIVHVVNDTILFGNEIVPLESLVSGYIALTELKSILENLDKISGQKYGVLSTLIHMLSNEGRKFKVRKKEKK